jgi:hypothetical protein
VIAAIVTWLAFCGINTGIAWWNDHVRRVRIRIGDPRQIEHFWYGLGYCLLVAAAWYFSRSWWQIGALLPLHLSVFTVAYNLYSDNPPFNLSKTSKALTDRFLVWLGFKSYEVVAVAAFILSIVFLILQISLR